MTSNLTTDIFIPTSNRIQALSACIDSLNAQTSKNFRVLLVGLRASPAVESSLEKCVFPVEYFIQREKGIIGAANEALSRSKADIFVRLDDDTVLDANWHSNLLMTYEDDPTVGGVTGPTIMSREGLASRHLTKYLLDESRAGKLGRRVTRLIFHQLLYGGRIRECSNFLESGVFTLGSNFPASSEASEIFDTTNLEACNWSCKRVHLLEIGGFDRKLTRGLGDYHESDAALKILNLGYRLVFNPKVKLRHMVEIGEVAPVRGESFYRIQNFITFYFRHRKTFSEKGAMSFGLLRFFLNLSIQNLYFIFNSLLNYRFDGLLALPGSFVGLTRVLINAIKKSR